ncbi:MAG: peptidoglycan DD-metalloendopeptidase family protein [Firmicutes bacterium]|nr:peptidoglycan DD-metalloendopeptidase family protein [Bacillota bacterium]
MKPSLALTLAGVLGTGVTMATAQAPAPDSGQLKQRLAEVQSRLSQVDQQLAALKKRRKGVLVELQGISLQADRLRAQADGARLKREQTENEVRHLTARKEGIQKDILRLREEMRRQVRWMQALGPMGGLGLFPSSEGFEEFLARGRYLSYWQSQQRRRLEQVQKLQGDLALREKELQAALQRLAQEAKEAQDLQASLRLSEERLQGFLDGLLSDESRQKEAQAELAEEALQLERMLNQLLGKSRAGEVFEAATPFVSQKGSLPRPVEGKLAAGIGEHVHPRFKTRTVQSGLLIEAAAGASVLCAGDGKVVFADSYQSYGPMVILDHGGGYFTLYTHLRSYQVSKGQILKQGESLGTVGDTLDGPRLGFEIRHLAQPEDPQKWLKNRYR